MSIGDTVKVKATAFREKLSFKYRARVGAKLADKESDLTAFESRLDERERIVAAREDKYLKYYSIPRVVIDLPVTIAVLTCAFWLYSVFKTDTDYESSPIVTTNPDESSASSDWDKDWNRVYKEVRPSDPNFDGEAYCGTRSGALTSDQCAAIVGLKQGLEE